MSKLTLAIIVKDEFELIKNIYEKYNKYFDNFSFAVDKDIEKFNEYFNGKADIIPYKWCDDFSHKRNFLADNVKTEYYFRIDSDDEIKNPEKIREVFNNAIKHNIDVVYFPYHYSKDEDNNVETIHWRETIIRKRPDIYWKKKIHENIFAEDMDSFSGIKCSDVIIVHDKTEEEAKASTLRNLKYLIAEFNRDGLNTDPRTISYIGRVLTSQGRYKEAIPFLQMLIERSGWDDDKYFAFIHLSECYQKLGDNNKALLCCDQAMNINTKYPDAFLKKGEVYIGLEEYQKAVDWLMPGIARPIPDSMFVIQPALYNVAAKIYACIAFMGIGDFDKAISFFNQVEKIAPSHAFVKTRKKEIFDLYTMDKYIKDLFNVVEYVRAKSPNLLNALLESIPANVLKDERVWNLKTAFCTPKQWSDKSVIIYCGQAWEDWAPPSVYTGIGGSEEAVIYLSKELVKLGFEVTVFNSCGDWAGEYGGVTYRNYYEFNPNDKFNHIVAWRGNIFSRQIIAKTKSIWMHDVPTGQFTKKNIDFLDRIIVLSEYHKSLLPDFIPEDKIFVSSNGINIDDFKNVFIARNPKRIIYTSSYDRGITNLLQIWPDVKKEVPDAELHLFYGWNTWIEMEKKGTRDPRQRLAIMELMNQEGVFEHGRVGHKQLIKELYKSGVYAYPSFFEEISCISAMKAQACGCIPVTTDYAALNETVKSGIKVRGKGGENNERYKEEIVKILKDEKRQEEIRKEVLRNKDSFGWNLVAEQWRDKLFVSEKVTSGKPLLVKGQPVSA